VGSEKDGRAGVRMSQAEVVIAGAYEEASDQALTLLSTSVLCRSSCCSFPGQGF
jgi:hypothetical protein